MTSMFSVFLATWFMLFAASPVFGGNICGGDFFCYLFFNVIIYLPHFLVLTVITFIILAVFRPKTSFAAKLTYSALASFILIFFYLNFLSNWIQKQELVNSYRQSLDHLDYKLYEPTHIPDGHRLFESRVDSDHLSFYYLGNGVGQFVISEFRKPQTIDLSPPYCQIGGFIGQNNDFEVRDGSGFSSAVYGNCQEIKTPKGTPVYLMTFNITSEKRLAAIILGNTLITISGYHFSDQELTDLIDGLEEKSVADITFKVIDRTIGR